MDQSQNWRWLSLVAALFGAGGTGIAYAYSVYSGALKARFNLGQREVERIGIAGNAAYLVSFVAGIIADRWGPAAATGVGGTIFALNYLAQWVICHFYPGLDASQVGITMQNRTIYVV